MVQREFFKSTVKRPCSAMLDGYHTRRFSSYQRKRLDITQLRLQFPGSSKGRIFSRANFVVVLGKGPFHLNPHPPLLRYFAFYPLGKVNILPPPRKEDQSADTLTPLEFLKDQEVPTQITLQKRPFKTRHVGTLIFLSWG